MLHLFHRFRRTAAFALPLALAVLTLPTRADIINARSLVDFPQHDLWSVPGHWDLNRTPATGDDVVFGAPGFSPPGTSTYDLGAGVQLRSLQLLAAAGALDISGGPIHLQSGATISMARSALLLNFLPGLALNGPATLSIGTGSSDADSLQIRGAITGTGPLTLSNTARHDGLRLQGANTYSGATLITGNQRVLVNGTLPSTTALTVDTGANAGFAVPNTVGSLTGGGNMEITGSFTVGGDNTSTTYTGAIAGGSAFIKTGTGTLTLSGAHTYTGYTLVSSGQLTLSGSTHASSTVTLAPGATLHGNGTGVINGNVLYAAGANITAITVLGTTTLLNPPDITSATSASTTYRSALSTYTITATNTANTPVTYGLTGTLPAGVTFTAATGTLSGTPTEAGSFSVTISVTTAAGTDSQALTITVDPQALTVSGLSAENKTYDGTATATLTGTGTLNGILSTDSVSLTGTPTGTFTSLNVGTGVNVTISGLSVSNSNYTLTPPTSSANITARPLTVSGLAASNKTYDGTATAAVTGTASLVNTVPGDSVALTGTPTGTFVDANVGNGKTVSIAGLSLTNGGNYSLTAPSATANITARPLTVSGLAASNKTYDGTATAAVTGTASLVNTVPGDSVALAGTPSGTFADANVGNGKTVSIAGLSLTNGGNYSLTAPAATANISALGITPGVTAANKVYDGTTTATLLTRSLTGVVPADAANVTLTGGTATFADANVGTGKTVTATGLALSGSAASNYQLSSMTAATTANISAAVATVSITSSPWTYDGTSTQATVTTTPVGLAVSVTYNGGLAFPRLAGTYLVAATIRDPNYTGSATGTLIIRPAEAAIALSGLAQTFTGSPISVSATTTPSGLPVTFTYNGSATPPTDPGSYSVVASIASPNHTGTASGTLTIARGGPTIAQPLVNQTVTAGATVTLAVTAQSNGGGTLRYQWHFNGQSIPGATSATLALNAVRVAQSGRYHVVVTNDIGSIESAAATITVQAFAEARVYFGTLRGTTGSFALALRADGTGTLLLFDATTSAGYVAALAVDRDGAFSGTAIATTTNAASLPVRGRIAGDDRSGTAGTWTLVFSGTGNDQPFAFGGAYTASTTGAAAISVHVIVGGGGQAIILIAGDRSTTLATGTVSPNGSFTLTAADGTSLTGTIAADGRLSGTLTRDGVTSRFVGSVIDPASNHRLGNISTRGFGGAGDAITIAGFTVGGTTPKQLLIRGIGPGLAQFGVSGFLTQPTLELFQGANRLATNTGWSTATNAAEIASAASATGAFALGNTSADSALLVTLAPGSYSALVRGANNTTGIALIEVYEVGIGASRLINLATRGAVGSDASQLIAGLVVTGRQPKRLLLRGVGPGLAAFGVANTLADPRLQIVQGATVLASNDDWGNAPALAGAAAATGAFALAPNSRDAALLITLEPGTYSVIVGGAANTAGIALVEIYELP